MVFLMACASSGVSYWLGQSISDDGLRINAKHTNKPSNDTLDATKSDAVR